MRINLVDIYTAILSIIFGTATIGFLLILNALIHGANANEIEPLTRNEPVVRMVLQEASTEPILGQVAVAGVAFDRMVDPRWPDTESTVIYQGNRSLRTAQFSGMAIGLRDHTHLEIERARRAVEAARRGMRPCGRVLWYHADWAAPDWDYSKIEVACHIGDHIFYKDRERN